MMPAEIDRLRMLARRAGRVESLMLEIADREEAGQDSTRLRSEVIDLLYSVVVAMPSPAVHPRPRAPSPCTSCRLADADLEPAERGGVER